MLFLVIILIIFSHSLFSCELPEHLQKKEFITIRTSEGKIDHFLSARVKCSGFLCQLAWQNKDSALDENSALDIDIDLMLVQTGLKKFFTQKNLKVVLDLIGNSDMKSWNNKHPEINLTDPFECIYLVDTIKFLELDNEKEILRFFITETKPDDNLPVFFHFRRALCYYSRGENIPACFVKNNPLCIIPPPQKELNLNKMKNHPKHNHKKESAIVIYNNNVTSVAFDIKQDPPLQEITIICQPQKPIPSLSFKNLSGYDGLSLTLKDADVTTQQHQELRKMLWPHKYKSTALTSLKYRFAETIVIGGSLISLYFLTLFHPFIPFIKFVLNRKDNFINNIAACLTIPLLVPPAIHTFSEKLVTPLRTIIYQHYDTQNELIIGTKKEKPDSCLPMVKILDNKLKFLIKVSREL